MGDLAVTGEAIDRTGCQVLRRGGRRANDSAPPLKRIASNFAVLCVAEVICRGASVLATLALTRRLRPAGYGRIAFAFNVVFWLVLIVRDCFETIITREVARHPRITRSLVDHVLAVKLALSVLFYAGLVAIGFRTLGERADAGLFALYGLLLFTTSLGIDFVYRGTERMGLIALSLCIRTAIYCTGVFCWVHSPAQIARVPFWLVAGEATGIALVWLVYARERGVPRPTFGLRFLFVMIRRGRSVALIQLSQAVLITADLMVVGLFTSWSDVGRYGAPHQVVSALMAFGLIFQQVVLPSLSRSWRRSAESGRKLLDLSVRVLILGFLPMAVGGTVLAGPIVRTLLPPDYQNMAVLLAVGIWRAPLLSLAFLYQTALIATNREAAGLRLLVGGAVASAPCIALGYGGFGMTGAACAVLGLAIVLVCAGYLCLAREGRAPAGHHHIVRPLISSLAMVPFCLWLKDFNVLLAVAVGAAVYLLVMTLVGGFRGLIRAGSTERTPGMAARLRLDLAGAGDADRP
jgi:O-antigen/teichoic acid export membrane protein